MLSTLILMARCGFDPSDTAAAKAFQASTRVNSHAHNCPGSATNGAGDLCPRADGLGNAKAGSGCRQHGKGVYLC